MGGASNDSFAYEVLLGRFVVSYHDYLPHYRPLAARCRVRRTVWFGIIDPREERVGVGSIGPHRFDGVVDLGAARPT